MSADIKSWKRLADGSYSGVIWTLPDRGPNDVGSVVGAMDYRNRINRFTIPLPALCRHRRSGAGGGVA